MHFHIHNCTNVRARSYQPLPPGADLAVKEADSEQAGRPQKQAAAQRVCRRLGGAGDTPTTCYCNNNTVTTATPTAFWSNVSWGLCLSIICVLAAALTRSAEGTSCNVQVAHQLIQFVRNSL